MHGVGFETDMKIKTNQKLTNNGTFTEKNSNVIILRQTILEYHYLESIFLFINN